MGYTTEFRGSCRITPEISLKHANYINQLSETRRMKRDASLAEKMDDPLRMAVGLPIGTEGAFFVGGTGSFGQGRDSSILNYNSPPADQPGLWCQWVVNDAGELEWSGMEKFYHYVEWLEYLIANFFGPWGYKLNGSIKYQGEERGDHGTIVVDENRVWTQ